MIIFYQNLLHLGPVRQ